MDQETQRQLGEIESTLVLEHTPVGLAFVNSRPSEASRPEAPVPSGFSFWRMAEREVLYTAPNDHKCPIEVMTMGFELATEQGPEAKSLLDLMCECEYISPDELSQVPGIPKGHQGVVYGPLGQMLVDPDVALFICRPGQEMLMAVPGPALTALAAKSRTIVAANATMEKVHVERRAQF